MKEISTENFYDGQKALYIMWRGKEYKYMLRHADKDSGSFSMGHGVYLGGGVQNGHPPPPPPPQVRTLYLYIGFINTYIILL